MKYKEPKDITQAESSRVTAAVTRHRCQLYQGLVGTSRACVHQSAQNTTGGGKLRRVMNSTY